MKRARITDRDEIDFGIDAFSGFALEYPAIQPRCMNRRLGIIVPYRDRKEHLAGFLACLKSYCEHDAVLKETRVHVLVVEQSPERDFNRGAIKNVGYLLLAQSSDYICFHDVDLVPVTADYGFPDRPAMIAHHGLGFDASFVKTLFGGVVLMQCDHFAKANGYSNEYVRWGFEDVDLRERLRMCDLAVEHREGTYQKLEHEDEGSDASGQPTAAHVENRNRYIDQWFIRVGPAFMRNPAPSDKWRLDGLKSVNFEVVRPANPILTRDSPALRVEHVVVQTRQ